MSSYLIYECMECGKKVAGHCRKLSGTKCDCGGGRIPTAEISQETLDEIFNKDSQRTIEGMTININDDFEFLKKYLGLLKDITGDERIGEEIRKEYLIKYLK